MEQGKKIAIVYDWIDKWGGVERVLLTLHAMFPEAIFFTSYFDKDKAFWAKDLSIKTSFLQEFPEFIKRNRIFSFIFYPYVFESFNFNEFDLVISVTSSFAKSVITQPKTKHICYLLTPTRYLWLYPQNYLGKGMLAKLLSPYIKAMKKWDLAASKRPDKVISISSEVARRTKKYYGINSEVIYPPFDVKYWLDIKKQVEADTSKSSKKNKGFFLVVSRLEPYKRVDLVVKAFRDNTDDLIIVGKGTQSRELRRIAGKNTTFLSDISDIQLAKLYKSAQALIMPQQEDFGYVSLEAQTFSCPVIAYSRGGSKETIMDGKTGILFSKQNLDSLKAALERFKTISYNLRTNTEKEALKNIEKFSKKKFIDKFSLSL